ncbi:MAG: hypothetical protein U0X73_00580 [Thermoanaerobaculia bacterium]
MPVDEPPAEAIERRSRERGPEPAVFFPSPRGAGHWGWWSFAELAARLRAPVSLPAVPSGDGAPAVEELAAGVAARLAEPSAARGALAALDDLIAPGARREILVARRPWSHPFEAGLLTWAVARGHALVLEPVPAAWIPTLAWARPTLLALAAGEIAPLTAALRSLAPRWGRGRWLAARGARLRNVLIEGEIGERVAEPLREWAPGAAIHRLARPPG